ncbi:hypothetical protein BZA70DRAFT_285189 [Myxozyma melibiosi]|uniref:Uncharacterized protein n=1 Tax=Myxozyma melibiosi TaxID=54550 RepID=A0ABR1EZ24_9ASCO
MPPDTVSSGSFTRRPVARQVTTLDAYSYITKLCYLEYLRRPRPHSLIQRVSQFLNDTDKKSQIISPERASISLLKHVRKDLKDYLRRHSNSSSKVTEMFAGFATAVESSPLKDRFKDSDMQIDELFNVFVPREKYKNLDFKQANQVSVAFADYVLFAMDRSRNAVDSLPRLRKFLGQVKDCCTAPEKYPLVAEAAHLFSIDEAMIRQDILKLSQSSLSESDYIDDLKVMSTSIITHSSTMSQFFSEQAYKTWREREVREMNQLIEMYLVIHPTRTSSVRSNDTKMTFIPPDAAAYYNVILKLAVEADLPLAKAQDELDPITDLLSDDSRKLLRTVSTNWRIKKSTRDVLFLNVVKDLYLAEILDINLLTVAFMASRRQSVQQHSEVVDPWTKQDKLTYANALHAIYDFSLKQLTTDLKLIFKITLVSDHKFVRNKLFCTFALIEDYICSDDGFQSTPKEFEKTVKEYREIVRVSAYDYFNQLVDSGPRGEELVDHLNLMHHVIPAALKQIKIVKHYYNLPFDFDGVDISRWSSSLFIARWTAEQLTHMCAYFAKAELDRLRAAKTSSKDEPAVALALEDIQDLHNNQLRLLKKEFEDAFGQKKKFPIDAEYELFDYIYRSIKDKQLVLSNWVNNIIAKEHSDPNAFEMINSNLRHSLNVSDLFATFQQNLKLIDDLDWENQYHVARLYNLVLSYISKAITTYLKNLAKAFNDDLNTGGPIRPATCVKLNNVEFIKNQLDALQKSIGAEKKTKLLDDLEKQQLKSSGQKPSRYIFTIEIVQAENLKSMDRNGYSDPYVELLNVHTQQVLFRTHTIYKELNPVWNARFELVTESSERIALRVWDEDPNDKRDLCGGCMLLLKPTDFVDDLAKDEWYDLKLSGEDSKGFGQVRVILTMERERDNILFHIGTAFKELRVTEEMMVSKLTSKFRSQISAYISHDALKRLLGSSVSRLLSRTTGPLTDDKIEDAIQPLFKILASDFKVFDATLTESMKMRVFLSAWSNMLQTIEMLIVPPLSERPTKQKPLTDGEMRILQIWVHEALDFFHGDSHGPEKEALQSSEHYKTIQVAQQFYSFPAPELITAYQHQSTETFNKMRQRKNMAVPKLLGRSRTIMAHQSLEKMEAEGKELEDALNAENSEVVILRILRMKDSSLLKRFLEERKRRADIISGQAAASTASALGGSSKPKAFNRVSHVPKYPAMPPLPTK